MLFLLLSLAVVGVSTFNGLACLWLSVSVALLNWRPASTPAPDEPPSFLLPALGVAQLALSALFFLAHSALIGRGLFTGGVGAQFWWVVAWMPLLTIPLLWYALSVVYSGPRAIRRHRWPLLLIGSMTLVALLTALRGGLPTYNQALNYEIASDDYLGVPLIAWIYLPTLLLCALLPIDALFVGLSQPDARSVARRRARPALIIGSLLLLVAGVVAASTLIWTLARLVHEPGPDLLVAMAIDLVVCSIIGIAVLVVGSAIVSYEVFTGGALPRRGFLQRWVGTVVVLLASAFVTATLAYLALRPIYGLLSATAVATAAYALLGWQNDRIRATFMARLRPFLAGAAPRSLPLGTSDAAWQQLFIALCRDILGTPRACLVRRASNGPHVPLRYGWDEASLPDPGHVLNLFTPSVGRNGTAQSKSGVLLDGRPLGVSWVLPLGNTTLEGALLFDARRGSGLYSEEEIDLAEACCERLLDALAGAQLTAVALSLLRQRIAEVTVVGARQRRVLHDEVLPELHAALIHLGSGRASEEGVQLSSASAEAVTTALSTAHRRLADLIHAIPPASPHRIEDGGLIGSLENMVKRDFGHAFERIDWQVDDQAQDAAAQLSPFAAEVVFYAAQEAVRNAARHGRGADGERPLHLQVCIVGNDGLRLQIADNGVGIGAPSVSTGSSSGLRFHEAMLAVIGGRLTASAPTTGGTLVSIILHTQH